MNNKQIEDIVLSVIKEMGTDITTDSNMLEVGVSARHVHLTQQDVEKLFGAGYTLTKHKELMGGQYACTETVTIISQAMQTMEKVRVLGPTRKNSQIEVSASDAIKLKIKIPVRDSGDIKGSAPVTIVGSAGSVTLSEGMIIAARHAHFSPQSAQQLGIKDGDMIKVATEGVRSIVFNNVKARVDETFTTEIHFDTDEANAAGIKTGDKVRIV